MHNFFEYVQGWRRFFVWGEVGKIVLSTGKKSTGGKKR